MPGVFDMTQIDELKRIRSILSAATGLEDDDQEYIEDARKAVDALIDGLAKSEPVQPMAWTELDLSLIDGLIYEASCAATGWDGESNRELADKQKSLHTARVALLKKIKATPTAAQPAVPLTNTEFGEQWFKQTGRIMGSDKQLLLQAKRVTEAAHGIKEKT
jgi:hypothetical protein